MKKYSSIIICIILVVLGYTTTYSQEAKNKESLVSFDVSADLVSRYIWRGAQYGGSSPNIQPNIALNIGNFQIGNWSSYSLGGNNFVQEFDFFLSYTFCKEMFSITLTDYYFPDDTANYNYYDYKNTETGHVLEGAFSFNGTEKIPIGVMLAVNFYGADAIRLDDDPTSADFNERTGIQYSTYAEISYSTNIKTVGFDAFLGLNLTNPKKEDISSGYLGESGYYGDNIGVVNIGLTASKAIPVTDKYEIPVSVSLITNPQAKKVYAVFAISF